MSGFGLGEDFDLSLGLTPVDLSVAASTGKRVSMQYVDCATVVLIKGAGTTTQDPVLTLKQHTAASGGVSSNLVAVSNYFTKSGAPGLLGSETWTQVSQTTAATVTLTGGAVNEMLVAINVTGETMTAGNGWISLDIADVGANAQLGMVLYVLRLDDHRYPTALPAGLR